MGMKPDTHYTKSGRINIAYQVFGSGEKDLVYIPGWVSNIDLMWDCPSLVIFFKELAKVVRIILFDKRGTGLSDRVSDLSPLEDRMDDIRAVMDAVGSKKAILFGHSEGGSVSALFSATYPHRTAGLITFGVFASRRWSEDYPWAPTDEERQQVYDMIDRDWGSGQMDLVSLAPSMAHDSDFMDWLARYFRSGASPNAAMALTKMNTQIDIRGILESIAVPTLLLQRTNDIDVKIEEGRYIASQIAGAKFVEFEGDDHLFWAGDTAEVLDQMVDFIEIACTEKRYSKSLVTILKIREVKMMGTDLIDSSQYASEEDRKMKYEVAVKQKIGQYLGNIIETSDSNVTAIFSGPSKAVHCAMDVKALSKMYKVEAAQGIHLGEVNSYHNQESDGIALRITGAIIDQAQANQILTTNSVNNLLSGTGLNFKPFGMLSISNQKSLQVMQLDETASFNDDENREELELVFSPIVTRNHSFLEDVMQSIEDHFTDELFGVASLSKDLGVSTRQLQRRLKAITNKSPNSLIRSVRLHKAKELIFQQNKSIKEAAYQTGFNSLSYFSNCFKKEFGECPSAI